MEKIDAAQPISITLDGSNYILWAQAMTSFLKGKKLWRIITGDVIKPVKAPEENQSKYEERFEVWDSKNHQVVTWIRNTSFLMALTTDFEPVRASLLHRNPLPTLDQAIAELLLEETHLGTLKSQSLDSVLAVHRPRDVRPSQSSSPSSLIPGSCTYCHSLSHKLLRCPVRTCKHCHKTGPGHYQSDCWKNPNKQSHGSNSRGQSRTSYSQGSQSKSNYQYKSNIASRPAAAATEDYDSTSPDSAPTPLTPQFSMTDVEAIIQ
ncbi:hypothetical protein RHSIM_Rhsim05G0139800 [Rhododendron simsii]|uniref:Retrotransposon Copia-like N-terminal domain-containing protein n=1 Tax=Rhododendron simsii TaxID=118357 RepID=A0A834LNN2_RHOSS|nr:hypothetical protein RHSIM_Rhsim05G0139800 [Rhododendron simsii]